MSKGDEKNGKRHIYNMVSFYDTYTSPEFQSMSERLRLHEFVQLPTAQIEDGAIVQLPIAQIEDVRSEIRNRPHNESDDDC